MKNTRKLNGWRWIAAKLLVMRQFMVKSRMLENRKHAATIQLLHQCQSSEHSNKKVSLDLNSFEMKACVSYLDCRFEWGSFGWLCGACHIHFSQIFDLRRSFSPFNGWNHNTVVHRTVGKIFIYFSSHYSFHFINLTRICEIPQVKIVSHSILTTWLR